jgi:hypothetical protein
MVGAVGGEVGTESLCEGEVLDPFVDVPTALQPAISTASKVQSARGAAARPRPGLSNLMNSSTGFCRSPFADIASPPQDSDRNRERG